MPGKRTPMTGKRSNPRPVLLPETLTVRLTREDMERLEKQAAVASVPVAELSRDLLRAGMGESLLPKTGERLRILDSMVQRNALIRAVKGEVLTDQWMQELEKDCAGRVDAVLQRRLALLEAADKEKGATA